LHQGQHWSLMTILYLSVCSPFVCLERSCWCRKYHRCAILEYHMQCMFKRLSKWRCANQSIHVSQSASMCWVCMSPCIHRVYFFWFATCSLGSDNLSNRCSEYSTLMSMVIWWTLLPFRGERDSRLSCQSNFNDRHSCELVWVCEPLKLTTNFTGFIRPYSKPRRELDRCRRICNIGWWATQPRNTFMILKHHPSHLDRSVTRYVSAI
jgi:hypothetical protein